MLYESASFSLSNKKIWIFFENDVSGQVRRTKTIISVDNSSKPVGGGWTVFANILLQTWNILLWSPNFYAIWLISYITNYYIGIINDNFYKYKILELGAKYENKMQKGNKIPLYLETFILNIINVFMKNDITKTKTKIIKIKK